MSLLIGNQRLAWKRYWVPWDGNIYTESNNFGFVREPKGRWGKISNPHLQSIEELLDRPFLVLSGSPGMGKTQAVEQLRESWPKLSPEEVLISVEGRTLDSSFAIRQETVDSPQWKIALQAGKRIRLIIDGVDEAILKQIDLTGMLRQALQNQPLDLIRVILVCRAAEWDAEEGKRFSLLWKAKEGPSDAKEELNSPAQQTGPDLKSSIVWELCPLCRSDAELAAAACGCDPKAFLAVITKRRVEGLAARPVTLRMLLNRFKLAPAFTTSFKKLYHDSILDLCGEVNEERRRYAHPYPPKAQVYRLAGRIAASLLFGRKSVIIKSMVTSEKPGIELAVTELEGEEIADGERFKIDRKLIDFTLDTPLFNFRGPNYGFEQKTYAEFLAADYVKGGTVEQLTSLFCVSISGRIVVAPHLGEVAAWTALHNDEWFKFLCEHDPEILLRADLSAVSEEGRKLAVHHLLKAAAEEKAFDHQGLDKFYPTLNHPTLGQQLRPYINNIAYNKVVRRIAISLAGECHVAALEKDLWKRAMANDPCITWIGHALSELAGIHSKNKLIQVLERRFPQSAYRPLGSTAIKVMVPKLMRMREILPYLCKSSKREGVDAYHIASNYHLQEHLETEDLVPALRWLKAIPNVFDSEHTLSALANHVFEKALKHLDDPAICKEAVSIWIKSLKRRRSIPRLFKVDDEDDEPHLNKAIQQRLIRQFAAALINAGVLAKYPQRYFGLQNLVGFQDSPWMLDQLGKAKPKRVADWAKLCGWYLRYEEAAKCPELLREQYAHQPELQKVLPALEPDLDIVDSLAAWERKGSERLEEEKQKTAASRPIPQSRKQIIDGLLQKPRPKNVEWVWLSEVLWHREPTDPVRQTRSHNLISSSPGWLVADNDTREALKKRAISFLLKYRNVPENDRVSAAAYRAIRLIFADLEHNPKLTKAIHDHWSPAIFDAFRDEDPDYPKIIQWAYLHNPAKGISILRRKMKNADSNGLADFPLEPYVLCWDKRLSRMAIKFVRVDTVDHRSIFGIIGWLAHHDPRGAEELVQHAGILTGQAGTTAKDLIILASTWLLLPQLTWTKITPRLFKMRITVLRSLLLKFVGEFSQRERPVLSRLTADQLADLGMLLNRIFPPHRFPGYRTMGVVSEVQAVDKIADLRRAVIGCLIAQGSERASDSVLLIAKASHAQDRIWLKWHHREAERSAAEKLVPSRQPEEIVQLLRSSEAALVDTEDDLIAVILESVRRLERKIKIHSVQWRALWNETEHRPVKKRRNVTGLDPKPEAALSDVVAEWLRADLSPAKGLVVNREVEVSKNKVLDLKIDIWAKTPERPLAVTIECKRCVGSDVKSGLKNQLTDRYLIPHGISHGLYLIGWYRGSWKPSKRPSWNPSSLVTARKEAAAWAHSGSQRGIRVESYVLDCTGHS